jgi:hypothetical protein
VHLIDHWDHNKNLTLIQKEWIPSGVLHLILFDANLHPLSERLVFVNNHDQALVIYKPDKEHYERRSLIKNSVSFTDANNEPLSGTFSVSVTSDREVQPDSTANILTQLLLTSDLKGAIENPAYYFRNTAESEYTLDLLMCTQGWRRYNILEMSQGNFTKPLIPLELGGEISGIVTNRSGRYLEDIEVNAIAFPSGFHYTTQTDMQGRFYLPVGDIPDSTSFIVSATLQRASSRVELLLDKEHFPKSVLPVIPSSGINRELYSKYLNKTQQQYSVENDDRATLLSAAIATAQRIPPRNSVFYKEADYSINEEELERFPPQDIVALLRRFPGVFVRSDDGNRIQIIITQHNLTGRPSDPLLLLDDEPLSIDNILDIPPSRIAQIDILKPGPKTAIFGHNGSQGIIAIYTKRADTHRSTATPLSLPHIKTLFPIGYQQPVEFYAPKYETQAQRNNYKPDLRTTIHWQPVVHINEYGAASFEFYGADEDTSFTVTIQGLANDGTIILSQEKIGRR